MALHVQGAIRHVLFICVCCLLCLFVCCVYLFVVFAACLFFVFVSFLTDLPAMRVLVISWMECGHILDEGSRQNEAKSKMAKMMMAVMAAMRWYPEKRPSVSAGSIGAFIAVRGCHPGATVWSTSHPNHPKPTLLLLM